MFQVITSNLSSDITKNKHSQEEKQKIKQYTSNIIQIIFIFACFDPRNHFLNFEPVVSGHPVIFIIHMQVTKYKSK